jgi:hypothetical protein
MTALIGGCGIASFLVFITLIAERKYKIVEQES